MRSLGSLHRAATLCDRHRASLHDPHSASSHPPAPKKAGLCLFVVVEVGRGCRIVLALLVSHRAKLWASTITHPCVCGRLGRRVLAPTLCDRHRASLHDPHSASSHPPAPKKAGLCLFRHNPAFLVPMAGVEPARYCYQRILSPSRLPIPSHRLIKMCCKTALHNGNNDFTV